MWADILAFINIVLGFSITGTQLFQVVKFKRFTYLWLRIIAMIVGLYWGSIYIFVILVTPGKYDPVIFGHIFIRPAFTFTLASILAASIYKIYTEECYK